MQQLLTDYPFWSALLATLIQTVPWYASVWALVVRIPQLRNALSDFGMELPRSVVLLISISNAVAHFFYAIPLLPLILLAANLGMIHLWMGHAVLIIWFAFAVAVPAGLYAFIMVTILRSK